MSGKRRMWRAAAAVPLLAALSLGLAAGPAAAHRLRPAVVTVGLGAAGEVEVSVQLNAEAALAGIGPQHEDTADAPQAQLYDAMRQMPPGELAELLEAYEPDFLDAVALSFDGEPATLEMVETEVPPVGDVALDRISTITLAGTYPTDARTMTWRYGPQLGANVLRAGPAGAPPVRSAWLQPGERAEMPLGGELLPRSRWRVAWDYTVLGFTHILPKGLDHILFVLGIFLLSLRWKPLLAQVTAFTIAHSITLALSLYDVVSLSPRIVEPLIALSIVYVAVENIITRDLKPWRVFVVFGFGLLHGLGFAGVLTELGLPPGEFVTALITFNVGVELGQLAVIGLAFLAVGLWFSRKTWYRQAIVIPGSVAISLIGAWWTLERIIS